MVGLSGLTAETGQRWAGFTRSQRFADQGKMAEAEQMYQRALEGLEKAFGPEHTSTLQTVNNLGTLYKNQGKLAEAKWVSYAVR